MASEGSSLAGPLGGLAFVLASGGAAALAWWLLSAPAPPQGERESTAPSRREASAPTSGAPLSSGGLSTAEASALEARVGELKALVRGRDHAALLAAWGEEVSPRERGLLLGALAALVDRPEVCEALLAHALDGEAAAQERVQALEAVARGPGDPGLDSALGVLSSEAGSVGASARRLRRDRGER